MDVNCINKIWVGVSPSFIWFGGDFARIGREVVDGRQEGREDDKR